jgi:SAM-dependent methyltransferase
MKTLDRLLQGWRIRKASAHIPAGSRLLDVGCGDGALFRCLGSRLREGLGVDPALKRRYEWDRFRLEPGTLRGLSRDVGLFDVITLLAVLEHVVEEHLETFAAGCAGMLRPGGRLIVTVHSPRVDVILAGLRRLGLVEGIRLEEHYGFDPGRTRALCEEAGLELRRHGRFQMGLNHLFVFEKPDPGSLTGGGSPRL